MAIPYARWPSDCNCPALMCIYRFRFIMHSPTICSGGIMFSRCLSGCPYVRWWSKRWHLFSHDVVSLYLVERLIMKLATNSRRRIAEKFHTVWGQMSRSQLPKHSTLLSDSNFLTRTLYKNTILGQTFLYPFTSCFSHHVYSLHCWPAFCHAVIDEYWLIDWLIVYKCVML